VGWVRRKPRWYLPPTPADCCNAATEEALLSMLCISWACIPASRAKAGQVKPLATPSREGQQLIQKRLVRPCHLHCRHWLCGLCLLFHPSCRHHLRRYHYRHSSHHSRHCHCCHRGPCSHRHRRFHKPDVLERSRINPDKPPRNFRDAMKALDRQAWAEDYNLEYLVFVERGVFKVVKPEPGVKIEAVCKVDPVEDLEGASLRWL
jgi:hypothetical protein